MTTKVQPIEIAKLKKLQVRAAECQATVETYAELYSRKGKEEVHMPALDVFRVGKDLYVVDGNHRLVAAELAGRRFLPCVIVGTGSLEDAKGAAIKCNHEHGLRRSNQDKRQAVRIALDLGWFDDCGSCRDVAKLLHLSHTFVNKQRKQYEAELKRQTGNVSSHDADHEPDAPDTDSSDLSERDEPSLGLGGVSDEEEADQAPEQATTEAGRYKSAAKSLQRVYDRLCESLGAVDPVCLKVNEARRLAQAGAV